MKIIPIKVVHYTELKKGDLMSLILPDIIGEEKCFERCHAFSVIKFKDIIYSKDHPGNVLIGEVILNSAIYPVSDVNNYRALMGEYWNNFLLVKLDGDGGNAEIESSNRANSNNDIPNYQIGEIKIQVPNN